MNIVQEKLFNLLKSFDEFCTKYNIKYCLAYGTVLGAIRHNGFIPWDDDIDLYLYKNEYKKLLKYKKFLPKNLFLDSMVTNKTYAYAFPKIRDKNIKCVDNSTKLSTNKNTFLWIDLFILDNYSDFSFKLVNKSWELYYDSLCDKNKYSCFYYFCYKFSLFFSKYSKSKKRIYCIGEKKDLSLVDFRNTKVVQFEDGFFPVMVEYDKYLKFCYGDWNKIPQNSERINHDVRLL